MGMGSYTKGMVVRIPFQITDGGIPIDDCNPVIEKIVLPDGSLAGGYPTPMSPVDRSLGTFESEYSPSIVGDYIVIISTNIDGTEYVSLENFTVKSVTSSGGSSSLIPRAESR